MITLGIVAALVAGNVATLAFCWAVIRRLDREVSKLQAAALVQVNPIAAAVYQNYNPEDERSPEQLLEDSPQTRKRDTKPLGL